MSLRSKMAAVIRRALDIRDPEGWPTTDSYSGEAVSERSALALSAVWGCVNVISGTLSSLPLTVYRKTSTGREEASDHPLYRILHDSPNADQTALDFWDFICASIELWGNAYARQVRLDNRLLSLEPVRPDIVTTRRLPNGSIGYRWTEDGKTYERPIRRCCTSAVLADRRSGVSRRCSLRGIRSGWPRRWSVQPASCSPMACARAVR